MSGPLSKGTTPAKGDSPPPGARMPLRRFAVRHRFADFARVSCDRRNSGPPSNGLGRCQGIWRTGVGGWGPPQGKPKAFTPPLPCPIVPCPSFLTCRSAPWPGPVLPDFPDGGTPLGACGREPPPQRDGRGLDKGSPFGERGPLLGPRGMSAAGQPTLTDRSTATPQSPLDNAYLVRRGPRRRPWAVGLSVCPTVPPKPD